MQRSTKKRVSIIMMCLSCLYKERLLKHENSKFTMLTSNVNIYFIVQHIPDPVSSL